MKWSPEEVDFLNSNYSHLKREDILKALPERKWSVIKSKTKLLKVHKKNPWTCNEVKLLKDNYEKLSYYEIKKMMPRRKINSISTKAYQLGITERMTNVNHLTDTEKGWISGLIDGEGTLTLKREKLKNYGFGYYPRLMIGNTNFELIQKIKFIIGSGHVSKYTNQNKNNSKPSWCFELTAGPIELLLKQVTDILIVKQKQAGIIQRVIEINKKYAGGKKIHITNEEKLELEKLFNEIRKLNKRGL